MFLFLDLWHRVADVYILAIAWDFPLDYITSWVYEVKGQILLDRPYVT